HGGFDFDSARQFLSGDAARYDGAGQVIISRYPDFLALTQVRAYVSMGREDEAVEVAAARIRERLEKPTKAALKATLKQAFRKRILALIDGGKKYEALAFYNKYAWAAPNDQEPLIDDYLLRLSQAAADLKFGSYARKLMAAYSEVESLLDANRRIATGY